MAKDSSVQIIKLFWRLDYDVSFPFYDRRGASIQAVMETVPEFLTRVGEARAQNRITGENEDTSVAVNLSVEPQSTNGSIEWALGTDFASVLQHIAFRNTNKVASQLLTISEVSKVKRTGIRFIILMQEPGLLDEFYKVDRMFGKKSLQVVEKSLGGADDVGITIEGIDRDSLKYRVSFGPFAKKNIEAHLTKAKDGLDMDYFEQFNLVVDLDIYENDHFLLEKSLYRWSNSAFAKAQAFVHNVLGMAKG